MADENAEQLIDHPAVHELYASELERINPSIEVKYQRIRRAVLADRAPSLERGELTPSAKVIRQRVCDNYRQKLDDLFKPDPTRCVIQVTEPQLQEALQ